MNEKQDLTLNTSEGPCRISTDKFCNEYNGNGFIKLTEFDRRAHSVAVRHLNVHENNGMFVFFVGEKLYRVAVSFDAKFLPRICGKFFDITVQNGCSDFYFVLRRYDRCFRSVIC